MSSKKRTRNLLSGIPRRLWPDAVVHHGVRLLLLFALGAGLVVLFPSDPGVNVGRYQAGVVADRELLAEVDFPVLKAPDVLSAEREAAAASVIPTFIYRDGVRDSVIAELTGFFERIDSAAAAGGTAGINGVLSQAGIEASADQIQLLADPGRTGRLEAAATSAILSLMPGGIMAPGVASQLTTDSIRVVRNGIPSVVSRDAVLSGRDFYDRALAGRTPGPETELLRTVLARYMGMSLELETERTDRDRAAARDTVQAVMAQVLRGEAIVRANQQVGPAEILKLEAYRDQLRAQGINVDGSNLRGAAGGIILNIMLLSVFGLLIFLFRRNIYQQFRTILVVGGMFTVYFLAAFLIDRQGIPDAALPIVFVTISVAILWDGRLALLTAFVLAAVTVVQEPFSSVDVFVTVLTGGAAAALAVRAFRRIAQTWLFIAIIAAAYAAAIFGLQLRGDEFGFLSSLIGALASTVIGAILAIGFLPVFEWLTGITTEQTLLGWADPNRALMRRLAVEAPGTYAHTIQVANLAEAGADAIGANALLCRVGMLYHDVGKMVKPSYFIENQAGVNPHDRLDPLTSAAIVRDHVVEGEKMARAEKVPEAVVDFITQHHGDQSIGFFLRRAEEQATQEGTDPPDPTRFRYPGPRPQTRETAIAMLADAIESATRALKDPTPERIQGLIEGIVANRVETGQLDESPLTLKDLAILKARFGKILGGIHHQRIDYPQTRHLTERTDAPPDPHSSPDAGAAGGPAVKGGDGESEPRGGSPDTRQAPHPDEGDGP